MEIWLIVLVLITTPFAMGDAEKGAKDLFLEPKAQKQGPPTQLPSPNEEEEEEVFVPPSHYRLEKYLMDNYNRRLIPRRSKKKPIMVHFSIGLYQIIEVNEPQRWKDELFYWHPEKFDGLTEIVLPQDSAWIPDTTLYNSLVMNDAESRRLNSVKITSLAEEETALVEMLYPTLYKFSCMLDLRFFPFDVQHCVMTFGSWTHDNKAIDYHHHNVTGGEAIGTEHCIENEGWNILSTDVLRREEKFQCCVNNYTLLDFYLHIQRKPLFYLVNLIIPTSVITLIAIVGFFSSSTVNDVREEKISLGITTLLSMSILIFMVSDQMPSTSSFIPLIGWFYTSMMMLISGGTLAASCVIYIQKKGIVGQRPSSRTMRWARRLGKLILMEMPLLMKQAYALKAKQDKFNKQQQLAAALATAEAQRRQRQQNQQGQQDNLSLHSQHQRDNNNRKQSIWQRWQKVSKDMTSSNQPHSPSPNSHKPSGFTSLLANNSAKAMAFIAPPFPPDPSSQAKKFWNHFPTYNNSSNNADNPGTPSSLSQKDSVGSEQREEGSGAVGNSVSFVDAPPQLHNYRRGTEDFTSTAPAAFSMDEESETATLAEGTPPPSSKSHPNAEQRGEGVPPYREMANMSSNKVRQRNSVSAAAFNHVNHPCKPPASHFNQDPTNPFAYLPIEAQLQLANSMANGFGFKRTNSNLTFNTQPPRPPPLFRRMASGSMADVYSCLGDPAMGQTANNQPNPIAAAAAQQQQQQQLHPSQIQRNLAEIEFDWLAAVVERLFLLVFCTLFFLMSFGINGIGMYYWYFTTVDTVVNT